MRSFPGFSESVHVDAVLEQELRDREVALGVLAAAEDLAADLLVERSAPDLRLGGARVVVELVEARHLRGLQRLVRDEGALHRPEPSAPERRPRLERPAQPHLGVELVLVPEHRGRLDRHRIAGREVGEAEVLRRTSPVSSNRSPLAPEGQGQAAREREVRVGVQVGVLDRERAGGDVGEAEVGVWRSKVIVSSESTSK